MKKLTLNRWLGDGTRVNRENWKDLISSLVLSGYEVYGDEDTIKIRLGEDDELEITNDE